MAYRLTLPGGAVVESDSLDEIEALIAKRAPVESASGDVRAAGWRNLAPRLNALKEWWPRLTPAARHLVEMRAAGMAPDDIARSAGRTRHAIEASLSYSRSRLDALARRAAAQPPALAAEDLPTPSPERGELLADQRGGARDELATPPLSAETTEHVVRDVARARRAQRCSICGAEGHNSRGHWASVAPPVPLPPARITVKPEVLAAHEARLVVDAALAPPGPGPTLIVPPPPVVLEPLPDTSPTPPALERARRRLAARDSAPGALRKGRQVTIAGNLTREERTAGAEIEYPEGVVRPKTRGDCTASGVGRPCPFVSCEHHLYLDVNPDAGTLKLNFPHLEVWEMAETCSLDVADRGGITLEEVGAILNLTRERVRQIEVRGLSKLADTEVGE